MARASGIVALLTDYGLQDAYVGILKGALLSANPAARIVDITHDIPPQDVREGSRVLAAARPYFPDGTVFVAVVDPGVGTDRDIIALETGRHTYVAPHNGLLDFLDDVRRGVRVTQSRYFRHPVSSTFHGRDILAPVAGLLAKGLDLRRLGPALRWTVKKAGSVRGEVVSVDRFGNLITDIPAASLPKDGLRITVGRRTLRALSRTYADAKKGELLALVGSTGHLEISVNQGSASRATRIGKGAAVRVTRSPK
jgi:S-adenosylmethionine hydrolase